MNQRLSQRVAAAMGATIERLEPPPGIEVEWDAFPTAKACAHPGWTHHEAAVGFYLTVTDERSGQSATASAICDVECCSTPFVSQVTVNLWSRCRFELQLLVDGFEGEYDQFDQTLSQEG